MIYRIANKVNVGTVNVKPSQSVTDYEGTKIQPDKMSHDVSTISQKEHNSIIPHQGFMLHQNMTSFPGMISQTHGVTSKYHGHDGVTSQINGVTSNDWSVGRVTLLTQGVTSQDHGMSSHQDMDLQSDHPKPLCCGITCIGRSEGGGGNKKAMRTIGLLVGVFLAAWLPIGIVFVIMSVNENLNPKWLIAGYWLGYLASTFNPVCYAIGNPIFRKALVNSLKKLKCCS